MIVMLKYNNWQIEHIKITIMMRQTYMYINLIVKSQKLQTKLLKFQEQ